MSSSIAAGSSAVAFTTPTKRVQAVGASEAGPSRRPAGASPAYSSRRHSLYGIEDRIVIDPGSRIWKVGFSGESAPRAVFWAEDEHESGQMWDFDLERISGVEGDREEGRRLVEVRVVKKLRETYLKHLMTDTKARKVIIVENTFLPTFVKDAIAQALFDNLKVPSISFTPSCLLALAAAGRHTGLVIDVGWLETTITPVFASRPLFHYARSTPLAGRALARRLRALLRHHAVYLPPSASIGFARRQRVRPVPMEVLSEKAVEKVLSEGCRVARPPTATVTANANASIVGPDTQQQRPEPAHPDSDINMGSESSGLTGLVDEYSNADHMETLKQRFQNSSTTPDNGLQIPHPSGSPVEYGTLVVPGWIRERVAEILFEEDEANGEDESIPSAILNCLIKLPVDLRQPMISSILVVGGTASLPGFIPRLRTSLYHLLTSTIQLTPDEALSTAAWRNRQHEPYRALYPLRGKLAVMNDPDPLEGEGVGGTGSGSGSGMAPRWTSGLFSWVGGSLAGALKTGAPEILRETYDTNIADSLARAEVFRQEISEEAERRAEAEVAAMLGISVEELRPGMALVGGEGQRKRGWREGVGVVGDWSKAGLGGLALGGSGHVAAVTTAVATAAPIGTTLRT